MDCLRRRRAGVWHWAVTWLHSTSVVHDGPSHFLSSFLSTLTLFSIPSYSVFNPAAATADALTAQRFTGAVKARNVVLMTDRELITKQGLTAIRRPAG